MAAFSELPGDVRMAAINGLCAISQYAGWHYTGNGITVTVPRGQFSEVLQWAKDNDLAECGGWYFPLGSDNPHESLRHDSSYPGSRGFWLYWHFVPIAAAGS